VGDIDQKRKATGEQEAKKRRSATEDDHEDAGDTTHALQWDADVERFSDLLDRALNGQRASMGSSEFRGLVLSYRNLSMMEKRAAANRMQKRRLAGLLRAIHANDYRMYTDSWELEARASRDENTESPQPDTP